MTFAPACLHTAGLMNLFRPNQELLGRIRELLVVIGSILNLLFEFEVLQNCCFIPKIGAEAAP